MSRSGYSYDIDNWQLIKWRGQVASAMRGKRGQQFLRDLIEALDALPEKALIANELQQGGNYCAIGAVGVKRGVDMSRLDPDDTATVSGKFDIAEQMVQEIVYENDENTWNFEKQSRETPEEKWRRMRAWAVANLNKEKK
jgi:hypothetical protein